MILLTAEELLHVAERTVGQAPEVRDFGLLHSTAARPGATVFGADAYPTFETKLAALVHSLIRNHALIDGNKRLGLAALLVTAAVNGHRVRWTNDEAYDFIIEIAEAGATTSTRSPGASRTAFRQMAGDPHPRHAS